MRQLIREHRWSLLAVYVIILATLVIGMWRIEGLAHQNHDLIRKLDKQGRIVDYKICVRVNNLNRLIVGSLQRQKKAARNIAYYKHHKKELRAALRLIDRQLKVFKPRRCTIKTFKG